MMSWAEKVKTRDNYTCAACGSTENLEAHHIIEQYKSVDYSNEIANGITLCRKCHRAIHGGAFNPKGSSIQPVSKSKIEILHQIKTHAESRGESLNGFINRAIDETIRHDTDAE